MRPDAKKRQVQRIAALHASAACEISDAIADLAEPGFQEVRSAKLLTDWLAANEFRVQYPWPHMPSAFRAVWGSRSPSIGILAEYDALPNCGPEPGDWGHGCGHNLLGTGSALGAIAAKELLAAKRLKGRVVLWGCPAEETLAGKVYMARDGAFKSDNAILGWHPGANAVGRYGGAAMDSLLFEFFGKTAHGASAHAGRSALDGVMLLDVACNYLREHVPDNVRIHMCVLDGGDAPNVVPAYAKCWYYVRAANREQVESVKARLIACARGAAMATGTKAKVTLLAGVYNRLPNDAMAAALTANLELFGPPRPSRKDKAAVKALGKEPRFATRISKGSSGPGRASSDEDNVSWIVPFGRFGVACASTGLTGHHREYAAQMKLPFAHRGMIRAGEVFAGAVADLCAKPSLLRKAKAEFKRRTKGFTYDPIVRKRQKPPSVNP